MWKQRLFAITLAASVIGMAACGDDDDLVGPDATFTANLTGAAEVPSVDTDASGTATFELDDGVMSYTINVANIDRVFAAHIHGPAGVDENAGVLVTLFAGPETDEVNGVLVSSTFVEAGIDAEGVSLSELVALMTSGQTYVNVHTRPDHAAGEIRGQIVAQ